MPDQSYVGTHPTATVAAPVSNSGDERRPGFRAGLRCARTAWAGAGGRRTRTPNVAKAASVPASGEKVGKNEQSPDGGRSSSRRRSRRTRWPFRRARLPRAGAWRAPAVCTSCMPHQLPTVTDGYGGAREHGARRRLIAAVRRERTGLVLLGAGLVTEQRVITERRVSPERRVSLRGSDGPSPPRRGVISRVRAAVRNGPAELEGPEEPCPAPSPTPRS